MEKLSTINGENVFWNLFENSTVGMSITTLDGQLQTNAAFCKLLGYLPSELANLNWIKLTHPDDIAFNKAVIDNILAGNKQSDRWEKRYIHKDGSIVWVDIHTLLYRDHEGKPMHFITTVNDISAQRSYAAALSKSELRLRTLIRQMNEGIAMLDVKGNFLFGNPAIAKMLCIKNEKFTSHNFNQLFGEELFSLIKDGIANSQSGELFHFDCDFFRPNLDKRNFSGCATSLESAEIFLLIRDISDQKRAEAEIKSQNEQLRISHAEKDKFFAILAHDLRTPISSFLGLTEVMAEDINDMTMSEVVDISKSLYYSASNLFQLLENLLEWSILKGGNAVYLPESSSLKRLINQSIEPLLESAKQKRIEVIIEMDQSFQVFCDIRMTETILRNLISNAIKFTRGKGKIVIRATPYAENQMMVSVCDNGIGMSSEIMESLFRINDQHKRKGTDGEISSGLGLLICKELIEKQGGTIMAESEEEIGSKFHITLPMAAAT